MGRRMGRWPDHHEPGGLPTCGPFSTRSGPAAAVGKPAYLQAHVCWAATEDEALAIAYDQWRSNVFAPPVCWDLELPAHFDEAARHVRPDDVRSRCSCRPIRRGTCDRLGELAALGFDGVWIHHVGKQQQPFLDMFGEHVLPGLRAV